jgi:hypothetical protein
MKVVLSDGKSAQAIKKEQLFFKSIYRMSDTEWRCETEKEMVVFKIRHELGSLWIGKGEREHDLLNMMPIAKVLNKKINFIDIMMAIDCTMDMDNMWDN